MSAARKQRRRRAKDELHPRGAEIDVVMAADRDWFERHPGRRHYARFGAAVERFEMRHYGGSKLADDEILITLIQQIVPGVRQRSFRVYRALPGDPREIDEATAKALWTHGGSWNGEPEVGL